MVVNGKAHDFFNKDIYLRGCKQFIHCNWTFAIISEKIIPIFRITQNERTKHLQPTAKPNSNNKVSYKYDLRKLCKILEKDKLEFSSNSEHVFSKENKTEY